MEFTRPATWDDVRTLARYLAEAGVEYALVGGYAVAAHGFMSRPVARIQDEIRRLSAAEKEEVLRTLLEEIDALLKK